MMAKRHIAAIEPPLCPKCGERMPLIRLAPNGAGSDVQTFECAKCGQTQTVETTDPVNEAAGRPAPGDLRPLQ
jgi:transposase-like protein